MKPATLRRRYLAEAGLALIGAFLRIKLVPASRYLAWCDRPIGRLNRFAVMDIEWTVWAVEKVGSAVGGLSPLTKALAVHAMLRRRGIACTLCLGCVIEGGMLRSHAWVERNARVLIGADGAESCTRMAVLGG
jgi:hypothetical protein